MEIKVYKRGVLEQELSLASGSYLLGRSSNCDIVLAEKNISRKHARLVIGDSEASIEDLGSSNGVLVGGTRIAKQKFLQDLSVTIGCFMILFQPVAEKGVEVKKKSTVSRFLFLAGSRPYMTSIFLLVSMYLFFVFAGFSLAGRYFESLFNTQEQQRAILISKALKEINITHWIDSDVTKFRIESFEKEEGVVQVFLVDTFGRILAPIDKVDHTIDHPLFAKSLQTGVLEIELHDNQEYFISNPVKSGALTYGAAIVTYRKRPYDSVVSINWWLLYGLLTALFLAAVVIARSLVKIFLRPWQSLSIDVGQAIRGGYDRLTTSAGYQELDDIKNLFERLLTRSSVAQTVSGLPLEKKSISKSGPYSAKEQSGHGSLQSPDILKSLLQQNKAACLVDLESHQVISSTPSFLKLFNVSDVDMCHILEVFQEEEILRAIMDLLEGRAEKSSISVSGSQMHVSVQKIADSAARVFLIFETQDT